MPQIGFAPSEAHQAIDELLAEQQAGGRAYERWIAAGEDIGKADVAVYIVPADQYEEVRSGYASWLEAQEVAGEDTDLPPGYRPWRHSPLATTERLLPIEPLLDPLARIFYGKPYAELSGRNLRDYEDGTAESKPDERGKVEYAAIACLTRVTFDPDGQGAVPVMAVGHNPDEPGNGLRWQIAFKTAVPGLFVRVSANGFLGEEWAIVTGSGYTLRSGFLARERADAAAEALGRVLPNTDWMRLAPDSYTPRAKEAIFAVLRRYQQWGKNDEHPELEPMTDVIPAPDEPAPAPAEK